MENRPCLSERTALKRHHDQQVNVRIGIWFPIRPLASPVKVILPLSFCYTTGLLSRFSEGGHHAGQSVCTFCREKSYFCDGTRHAGTRPGSGATRCLVCSHGKQAVHPHLVVFDRL